MPILKPGQDTAAPASYQPIALTSCLGKVVEKLINNRLKWYLNKHNLLPLFQTEFRQGGNTSDNLVNLESAIKVGFNEKKIPTVIFFWYSQGLWLSVNHWPTFQINKNEDPRTYPEMASKLPDQ